MEEEVSLILYFPACAMSTYSSCLWYWVGSDIAPFKSQDYGRILYVMQCFWLNGVVDWLLDNFLICIVFSFLHRSLAYFPHSWFHLCGPLYFWKCFSYCPSSVWQSCCWLVLMLWSIVMLHHCASLNLETCILLETITINPDLTLCCKCLRDTFYDHFGKTQCFSI